MEIKNIKDLERELKEIEEKEDRERLSETELKELVVRKFKEFKGTYPKEEEIKRDVEIIKRVKLRFENA